MPTSSVIDTRKTTQLPLQLLLPLSRDFSFLFALQIFQILKYIVILKLPPRKNRSMNKFEKLSNDFVIFQFLQYDIVTPPLTEFTFCTWIRVYDLAGDQSIFTYVGKFSQITQIVFINSTCHEGRNKNCHYNGKEQY